MEGDQRIRSHAKIDNSTAKDKIDIVFDVRWWEEKKRKRNATPAVQCEMARGVEIIVMSLTS